MVSDLLRAKNCFDRTALQSEETGTFMRANDLPLSHWSKLHLAGGPRLVDYPRYRSSASRAGRAVKGLLGRAPARPRRITETLALLARIIGPATVCKCRLELTLSSVLFKIINGSTDLALKIAQ